MVFVVGFLATNSLLQNLRSWRRMEFLRYLDITSIGSLKNISKQHLLGCLLSFKKMISSKKYTKQALFSVFQVLNNRVHTSCLWMKSEIEFASSIQKVCVGSVCIGIY